MCESSSIVTRCIFLCKAVELLEALASEPFEDEDDDLSEVEVAETTGNSARATRAEVVSLIACSVSLSLA